MNLVHVFFLKFSELLFNHILMLPFVHKIFDCFLWPRQFLHHFSISSSSLSFISFLSKSKFFPLISSSLFKILKHSIHWIISGLESPMSLLFRLFILIVSFKLIYFRLLWVLLEFIQTSLIAFVEHFYSQVSKWWSVGISDTHFLFAQFYFLYHNFLLYIHFNFIIFINLFNFLLIFLCNFV
jgi:hypothetical protein